MRETRKKKRGKKQQQKYKNKQIELDNKKNKLIPKIIS